MSREFRTLGMPTRLRFIRHAGGLSQARFADFLGIAERSELSRAESGAYKTSPYLQNKIADSLGLDVSDLFHDYGLAKEVTNSVASIIAFVKAGR